MAALRSAPEFRAKQRESKLALYSDPDYVQKCRDSHNTPEYLAGQSARSKAWWQNEEYIQKIKKAANTPEFKAKHSRRIREALSDPAVREKLSVAQKKLWKDPSHTSKMMIAFGRRPNGLESLFDELTSPEIAYVGDGTFFKTWPNGRIKNPDFRVYDKDGNPVKMIIELFGDYWHAGDDVQLHMEMWHRIGYSCLVIWEHELHENQERVLDLVSDFIGEEARSV